jgi:hypothetical protein
MAKPSIPFKVVPLSAVPSKPPFKYPPAHPRGSQWDEALKALERHPDCAIQIEEPHIARRNKYKSTLTIMAHNRRMSIEVRDDGDSSIFAFLTDRDGRFHDPIS